MYRLLFLSLRSSWGEDFEGAEDGAWIFLCLGSSSKPAGAVPVESHLLSAGGCRGPPAVLAHVAAVWAHGWSGSFLCAWAGRGSLACAVPPELWDSFPVSGVELGARSAGRCGLSSQVCVAEQGQLSCWVSLESQELQSEWWLWEVQRCRMCFPLPPAHGDLPSILVPSTR